MTDVIRQERALGPLEVGLRRDLHVTRQRTRGGPRYMVHDPITFQNHAFSELDYRLLTAIVPGRPLSAVFAGLVEKDVLHEDDKKDFYDFVLWLHGVGLLQLPISRGDHLFERNQAKAAARRRAWYRIFLSCKVPICNPDRFLQRTQHAVSWIFSRGGVALWAGLMLLVAWKCLGRFDELFAQTSGLLSLSNLPILWIALVVLKVIHEFGHAYACRRYGGPVPEMGVVFIFLTPCAYVDANASWKFGLRRHRIAVALAGMYVESIIAGIAALVWAGTQPGLVHDIALNVVVLASLATVFLNLNPLMKFDGYYLFSDITGVFNLQGRATRFVKGWLGHLVLGQPRPSDEYTRGEKWLYGTYGPAAAIYRAVIAVAITRLVMLQWPGAGMFLGVVFAWALIVQPVAQLFAHLWSGDETRDVRTRARLVAAGALATTPIVLALLPVSFSIVVPGILDPRQRDTVRAPASGFLVDVLADNGDDVGSGEMLCVLHNPDLERRRLRLEGEMESEQTTLDAVELVDSTEAMTHRARLAYLEAGVEEIRDRLDSMHVAAPVSGTVVGSELDSALGRFVRQGEELLQVQSGHHYLRIVLTEHEISRARLEVGSEARVRWTSDPASTVRAVVREIRRSASRSQIPMALTMLAGGDVYAQPMDEDTALADQPYLHVFLEAESIPLEAQGDGLTARVLLPARVEVLGGLIKRKLWSFFNAWRMT